MKKYLLYCFLFILLDLFTINSNIVNAWTYDDFITFTENNYQYQTNINYKNAMIKTIENLQANKAILQDLSINVDDYTSFYGAYDNGTGKTYFYFLNNTDNSVCSYSTSSFQISNIVGYRVRTINYLIYAESKEAITTLTLSKDKGWGLGYCQSSFVYQDTPIIENYLNYCEILPRENLNTSNLPWYIADGRIGVKNRNDNLHFYLHDINNIFFKELLASNVGNYNSGSQYQLFIQNTSGLFNGGEYYISIQTSGDSVSYLDSNTFLLTWLDNSSGSSSGDSPGGSIDLTETNQLIKDLPSEIGKVFYNSGDGSGDKGIVQKIYEDLFTLDSGDVQDIYENLAGKIDSGDTPLVVFSPFLDVLRNEPGDFIISWDTIPLHLTFNDGEDLINTNFISGDSINFSALARNNETIGVLKFWINTILAFSIFTMITLDLYKLVLRALGVTTDFVSDMDQEEETTVLYNSVSQSSTLDTKTGELKPRPVIYTTTKSTRRRL